ncbi:MAG TPA: hypothetical protein VLM16_04190 [Ginsengibacter sp.]|nr:hypothetical protein [Ginsengibacter sp.]
MKIEFKQKQIEQLALENLKEDQFLTIALETSNRLGWIIGNTTSTGFTAYTNNGLFAWNAEIKMKIMNGSATLQSQSRENEPADVLGNKMNIRNFISTFSSLKNASPVKREAAFENFSASFA